MSVTAVESLQTTVEYGLDGPVLVSSGRLTAQTAPSLNALLGCVQETGETAIDLDLRLVDADEDVIDLVLRHWSATAAGPRAYRLQARRTS